MEFIWWIIMLSIIFVVIGSFYYYLKLKDGVKRAKSMLVDTCPNYWADLSPKGDGSKCTNIHNLGGSSVQMNENFFTKYENKNDVSSDNLIDAFPATSEQCKTRCMSNIKCLAYTIYDDKECRLKKSQNVGMLIDNNKYNTFVKQSDETIANEGVYDFSPNGNYKDNYAKYVWATDENVNVSWNGVTNNKTLSGCL